MVDVISLRFLSSESKRRRRASAETSTGGGGCEVVFVSPLSSIDYSVEGQGENNHSNSKDNGEVDADKEKKSRKTLFRVMSGNCELLSGSDSDAGGRGYRCSHVSKKQIGRVPLPRYCAAEFELQSPVAAPQHNAGTSVAPINNKSRQTLLVAASRKRVTVSSLVRTSTHSSHSTPFNSTFWGVEFEITHRKHHHVTCMAVSAKGATSIRSALTTSSTGGDSGPQEAEEEGVLVTGHDSGEILVWHGFAGFVAAHWRARADSQQDGEEVGGEGRRLRQKRAVRRVPPPAVCSILHWHAHPVAALALSADDRMLYSGGEEAVLVAWPLSTGGLANANARSFFPRLGGPITHIAASLAGSAAPQSVVGSSWLGVTTSDNCMHLLEASTLSETWVRRALCVTSRQQSVSHAKVLLLDQHSSLLLDEAESGDMANEGKGPKSTFRGALNNNAYFFSHRHKGTANASSPALNQSFVQSDHSWTCRLKWESSSGSYSGGEGKLVCNGYPGVLQVLETRALCPLSVVAAGKEENDDKNTSLALQQGGLGVGSCSAVYPVTPYTRVSRQEANSKLFAPSVTFFEFAANETLGKSFF